MSIDMYVSSSQDQATSVSNMCREQIQSYQSLQKAISQFTLTTPNLKGATYDSAKAYFSNVLYPLAQGGMILSEAVEKAVSAFPEEYLSQVDSIDLKQSELEEQIREINRLLNEAREIRTQLMSTTTGETSLFQLGSNLVVIGMYTDVKKKLEEKLRKLLLFDARSTLIFLEIDSLRKAVAKGIEQTKTAWNGATGTFTVPNDLSWKTTIQEKWTTYEMEKEPEIDIREEVYPNGPNGDIVIYNVYVDGVYDDKQSNELNTMIAKNQLKEGLHFVGEFVLINDIYRVINGKDWLSGEESSRLEAAGWLALTAMPVSELAKIAKEIKAGNKVLKGVDLTEKELKLLNDAGYFKAAAVKETTIVGEKASGADDNIIVDGSHLIDGKLKPNTKYKSGEHGYSYETNSNGVIEHASTDNLQLKTHEGRLPHNPDTPDKLQGDHAGHLFGDRFGGSGELDNLVSQAQNVNLSSYKKLENTWAKAVNQGEKVTVDIRINYASSSLRPVSFEVNYTIDGVDFYEFIHN